MMKKTLILATGNYTIHTITKTFYISKTVNHCHMRRDYVGHQKLPSRYITCRKIQQKNLSRRTKIMQNSQ